MWARAEEHIRFYKLGKIASNGGALSSEPVLSALG